MPNKGYKQTGEHTEKSRMARKGLVAWNKNKKFPEFSGENNSRWISDLICYGALHNWIRKKLGKASKCVICDGQRSQTFDWANISGEYKRDLSDYVQLCRSCHVRYDWSRKQFNLQTFISG